jgi:hypothetical protein
VTLGEVISSALAVMENAKITEASVKIAKTIDKIFLFIVFFSLHPFTVIFSIILTNVIAAACGYNVGGGKINQFDFRFFVVHFYLHTFSFQNKQKVRLPKQPHKNANSDSRQTNFT